MMKDHDAHAREGEPSGDLLPLIAAGYVLIPLHSAEELDERGRSLGKRPRDKDWTTRDYSGFDAVAWRAAGNNVGVRPGDEDLVVDVDPRNFPEGVDVLKKLEDDVGVSLRSAPCVITGSGGFHLYLRKPADWRTRTHVMPDYPGVEFKTRGAQLVAPGSVHPNGRRYEWGFGGEVGERTHAPQALLDVVRRRPRAPSADAGAITPEELARLLAVLPPEDFRDFNGWLELMMASHHATAGQGCAAFAEWSTSDPKYPHTGPEVEYRWSTLDDDGGITFRTLVWQVQRREAGADALHAVREQMAVRDFADAEPPEDLDRFDDALRVAKPVIRVVPGELARMIAEAERALVDAGEGIFVRGPDLVRLVRVGSVDRRDDGIRRSADSIVLEPVTNHWLQVRMGVAADFVARPAGAPPKDGRARLRRVDPTLDLATKLLARKGEWPFRPIRAVLQTPTLTSAGELVQEPGYDAASGLYLDVAHGAFPRIEDRPSREDAEAALGTLKRPIRAFPFVDGAARAVALSAMLTGLIRPSLESAPMHAFDAPTPRTGKSLLIDIVSIIATGKKAPAMPFGASNDESEKRLASALMAGDQLLAIDNVTRPVEGELLCMMLTQSAVQTRVLGKSQRVVLPSTCFVTVTGNNLTFTGDVSQRVVTCRLNANVERPELRRFDFSATDEARAGRPALVAAALTVLRAYAAAGRPLDGKLTPLGGFEDWRLVREALVWLGEEDPALTVDTALAQDPETETLRRMLALWHEAYGGTAVTAPRLNEDYVDVDSPAAQLRRLMAESWSEGRPLTGQRISAQLRKYKGRIAGGLRLAPAGEVGRFDAWRVEPAQ